MFKRFKNLKKIVYYIFCVVFLFGFLVNPVVKADEFGLDSAAQKSGFKTEGSLGLAGIVGQIVGYVLSLLGVLFMILIIYAGFLWMMARGNDAESTKAKDMMVNAVIGLIIVFGSYAISSYIIEGLAEVIL